ncbi:ribosomal protein S18 acetylase RimI-like enzyme [Kineothrix alysoides]|uniref:Ribosomal protein S18 acetylase RimI-like enzyme n=1 Tax=Kineothrix alysoides TaxID=1469948 RepID=A0A4R1QYN5_9FIRM|nr:GNAT family N-acetyltransferase [Kineothrix alysoides]TCL58071.1 ribosomal protein S18 acetylase RimI-like enzyme [Kineothrix alysoides]
MEQIVKIEMAAQGDVQDCIEALMESELGRKYFRDYEKSEKTITSAFKDKELYAARNDKGECLGFVWFLPNGAFHSFPYLHIIAVKEKYRGCGIGTNLLRFYEELAGSYAKKAFLIVDDFNPKAKKLYEREGYHEVGVLPDLYIKGIHGFLMMKTFE